VSTVTPHLSLPRKPLGRTFVIAISLLAAFAVIQFLALIGHFIPALRKQLADSTLQNQQQPTLTTAEAARPAPTAAALPQDAPVTTAAMDRQKVERFRSDADRSVRIGDYDSALKSLEAAEAVVPGDPSILRRKAFVLERLDQPADAAVALEAALRSPLLPPADRASMEKKLDQLSTSLGTSTSQSGTAPAQSTDANAAAMEENGVPIGSSLGIVDVRLSDPKVGTKALQIAVKARENSSINVKDVKIAVYFYESTPDGEVSFSEAKPQYQWTSPPIDWANNEPELLKLQYTQPSDDSGKKYYGYVVGIYYNNELQDFRSEPAKLAKDYPPALFLKQDTE
jgi:hypothetical protein